MPLMRADGPSCRRIRPCRYISKRTGRNEFNFPNLWELVGGAYLPRILDVEHLDRLTRKYLEPSR